MNTSVFSGNTVTRTVFGSRILPGRPIFSTSLRDVLARNDFRKSSCGLNSPDQFAKQALEGSALRRDLGAIGPTVFFRHFQDAEARITMCYKSRASERRSDHRPAL